MFQLQPGEKRGILNFYKSAPQTDGIPVNPKGYFANERTFLHWLSMNLVLGGLGVGLLNFGGLNAQISGVLFCLVSLYFAGYSLIQYHKRADLLANKAKGVDYEDMNGILALIFVVSIAIYYVMVWYEHGDCSKIPKGVCRPVHGRYYAHEILVGPLF